MKQEMSRVQAHKRYQGEYHVLTLSAPRIAPTVRPGQFLGLLVPRLREAVLRRPFSVFQADSSSVSILYKVVGKGTQAMQLLAEGDSVDIIGPLGNGFPRADPSLFPVLIAGGYGIAALYLLAKTLATKGAAFFGGRSEEDILCVDLFQQLGWEVQVATEDGSWGSTGMVTDIFDGWTDHNLRLKRKQKGMEVFACGPQGMLRAVAERACRRGFTAWLSLDRHMACGVGACLTCVIKRHTQDDGWQWARCCKDGPVFEAREIRWDE